MSETSEDRFFSEPAKLERRKALQPVVTRALLRASRRANSIASVLWSDAEKAALQPFGDKVKAGEMSYYRACMESAALLPGRSSEAIRKKLKNWVNYGVFR